MTLTSLLGSEYPLIQAPMAGVQGSALTIAVCEAGALGSLPCAMLSLDAMRTEIERIRSGTRRSYNVNFFCHAPPTPDPQRENQWRTKLQPLYAELGIYLLCPEATTSAVHRAALKSPAASHTALTNVFTGRPARAIVNRIVRELGPINDGAPPFPLAAAPLLPLRTAAERQGSGDFSPLWAGQHVACQEIPAAELTRQLLAGF